MKMYNNIVFLIPEEHRGRKKKSMLQLASSAQVAAQVGPQGVRLQGSRRFLAQSQSLLQHAAMGILQARLEAEARQAAAQEADCLEDSLDEAVSLPSYCTAR